MLLPLRINRIAAEYSITSNIRLALWTRPNAIQFKQNANAETHTQAAQSSKGMWACVYLTFYSWALPLCCIIQYEWIHAKFSLFFRFNHNDT